MRGGLRYHARGSEVSYEGVYDIHNGVYRIPIGAFVLCKLIVLWERTCQFNVSRVQHLGSWSHFSYDG